MASRRERCLSDFKCAADAVREVLLAALPPDVPPSFREIVSARFVGTGRACRAVARLIMFDGQPAVAEVFVAGRHEAFAMWGHCWTEMPGGACFYEVDRWVRCDCEGNILPDQAAFDFQSTSLSASGAVNHGAL